MQHVNEIPMAPATCTYASIPAEPPRDYVICSICTFCLIGNPFCLGLAALIFSIKARDRKVVGDMEGAKSHASTAKCLNITASVIFALISLAIIIAVIVSTVSFHNNYNRYYG
uniref:dispanin subfamily A member 2b-like n=1 Tax=Doryrhamphus excisus TaxID=161450 RepID=UPI0025ADFD17|nr:dispanin subfamily A member 2b-like [Doryrhamphus excisus]